MSADSIKFLNVSLPSLPRRTRIHHRSVCGSADNMASRIRLLGDKAISPNISYPRPVLERHIVRSSNAMEERPVAAFVNVYRKLPLKHAICVTRRRFKLNFTLYYKTGHEEDMTTPLSLLGVTSLLGGDIIKGSIRFINANQKRCVTSFLVVPGLYSLATQMLKRSDSALACALSPGEREDKKKMVGLKGSNKYKYTGMRSGTTASVCNALCEGWLNEEFKKEEMKDSKLYAEGMRSTTILEVSLEKSRPGEIICCGDNEKILMWISLILQFVAFSGIGLMRHFGDAAGMALIVANMISYFAICVTATNDVYKTPHSVPSKDVPEGNSIVTDETNNKIGVVMGCEEDVQNFMQNDVSVEKKKMLWEAVAPVLGILTSVATILVTPILSKRSQYILAGELIIGLLSGIFFSSRNGDCTLKNIANKYYTVKATKTRYTNRAAAVAAAMLRTGGNVNNLGTLVPKNDETDNWKKYAILLDDINKHESFKSEICGKRSLTSAIEYMKEKFSSANSLCDGSQFSRRLVIDVLEAAIDVYGCDVRWTRSSET